jgi:deazaflavin-dependent oxidoreductase (nitroreductase family)
MADYYRAPGWFTRHVFNPLVTILTRQGLSVLGSKVLTVRGRKSGELQSTPVNPLSLGGRRYLVAPRGETQWARNLRAAGTGELRAGRRSESFRGRELSDDEKVPVLRAYLKRWKAETGIFFEGIGPDSADEQIRAVAPRHPAFEVLPADLSSRARRGGRRRCRRGGLFRRWMICRTRPADAGPAAAARTRPR